MIVVYCADKNYYNILPTAVNSLLQHNDVERVYCLIEDDYLESLKHSKIQILNYKRYDLPECDMNSKGKYPYSALVRCFLDQILEEDKILYLDSDTLVLQNIQDIWYTNIHNNYLAAVRENSHYYNSGVMLMNLDYMRKYNSSQKLLKVLNSRVLQFPDQDAINLAFEGKIRNLPYKFNVCDLYNHNSKNCQWAIRHFTSKQKPWIKTCEYAEDLELWNKYKVTKV